MLLRRVIEHVKAQNWTAVALDFVIVVVGVFMGIQVSNWNDARGDRAQERLLLQRLQADFISLAAESDQKITTLEENVRVASELTQHIREFPSTVDAEAYSEMIVRVFSVPSSTGLSDTYSEIVSSGAMHLISSESLRSSLVAHASKTREYRETQQARREFSRPHVAPLYRFWILIGESGLDEAFAAAGGENELLVAMRTAEDMHRGELQSFQDFKESVLTVMQILETESGPP